MRTSKTFLYLFTTQIRLTCKSEIVSVRNFSDQMLYLMFINILCHHQRLKRAIRRILEEWLLMLAGIYRPQETASRAINLDDAVWTMAIVKGLLLAENLPNYHCTIASQETRLPPRYRVPCDLNHGGVFLILQKNDRNTSKSY